MNKYAGYFILNAYNDRHYCRQIQQLAAEELAAMEIRQAALEAELAHTRDLAWRAQEKLRSAQVNWQENCYFECDDLLSGILGEPEYIDKEKEGG
jgi:hypothetical protein